MDIESIVNKRCEGRDGVPGHQEQVDILARILWCLLQPDGCAWDRKQTHQTLTRHMIEEAFEAAEAMESNDIDNLQEELGDVMLQVALHSAIAERDGEFSMEDVVRSLNEKLVRRHPHIFGDLQADNDEDVLNIWQSVKKEEKEERKEDLFEGIPVALPALTQAQLLQDRARENNISACESDPSAKVHDCLSALENENLSKEDAQEIMGDMLFSLVSLAKVYNVDAESALRGACRTYRKNAQATNPHEEA